MAAVLPASPWLLAALLLIGFGSLGQFPVYYALTQELSARRMGNVTGMFSFIFWLSYALVSGPIGVWIDRTGSYSQVMLIAGLLPLLGLVALTRALGRDRAANVGMKPTGISYENASSVPHRVVWWRVWA